jgi:hypothetical protein
VQYQRVKGEKIRNEGFSEVIDAISVANNFNLPRLGFPRQSVPIFDGLPDDINVP